MFSLSFTICRCFELGFAIMCRFVLHLNGGIIVMLFNSSHSRVISGAGCVCMLQATSYHLLPSVSIRLFIPCCCTSAVRCAVHFRAHCLVRSRQFHVARTIVGITLAAVVSLIFACSAYISMLNYGREESGR